jgi:hypothetical protein
MLELLREENQMSSLQTLFIDWAKNVRFYGEVITCISDMFPVIHKNLKTLNLFMDLNNDHPVWHATMISLYLLKMVWVLFSYIAIMSIISESVIITDYVVVFHYSPINWFNIINHHVLTSKIYYAGSLWQAGAPWEGSW